MLDPQKTSDYLKYTAQLTPPDGYSLSFAVGATYSLDLEALALACLSLGGAKESDSDLAMIDTLSKSSDKIMMFADRCAISSDGMTNEVNTLLDSVLYSVVPDKGSSDDPSFHPKVWVIRYVKNDDPKSFRYRFIVLSRNLRINKNKNSNNADVIFSMDGIENDDAKNQTRNQPLCDFLRVLKRKASYTGKARLGKLDELIGQLKSVRFAPSLKEFDDDEFEFMPYGISDLSFGEKAEKALYSDKYKRILIMSPFLEKETVKKFADNSEELWLITRCEALKDIDEEVFNSEKVRIFVINPTVSSFVSDIPDIHAKIYMTEKQDKTTELYAGSLNATRSAFYRNVEFMIRLRCTERFTLDKLKKQLTKDPFCEATKEDREQSLAGASVDRDIDKLKRALCHLNASAEVKGSSITVTFEDTESLDRKKNMFDLGDFIIKLRPNRLGTDSYQQFSAQITFSGVEIKNMSSIYIAKIERRSSDESYEFPLPIPTPIPDERNAELIRSCIPPDKLVEYLKNIMLSNSSSKREDRSNNDGDGSSFPTLPIRDGILELMLDAAYSGELDDLFGFLSYYNSSALNNEDIKSLTNMYNTIKGVTDKWKQGNS